MLATVLSARTGSPEETRDFARQLGELARPGDCFTLRGEMGAGKTTFVQGLAAGLGVTEPVVSPTFSLVHQYPGRLTLWHVDAYRLRSPEEGLDLGLEEITACGGVLAIEWPERLHPLLPPDRLGIDLSCPGENERRLRVTGTGRRAEEILTSLSANAAELLRS